jgi:hypothetical protein
MIMVAFEVEQVRSENGRRDGKSHREGAETQRRQEKLETIPLSSILRASANRVRGKGFTLS